MASTLSSWLITSCEKFSTAKISRAYTLSSGHSSGGSLSCRRARVKFSGRCETVTLLGAALFPCITIPPWRRSPIGEGGRPIGKRVRGWEGGSAPIDEGGVRKFDLTVAETPAQAAPSEGHTCLLTRQGTMLISTLADTASCRFTAFSSLYDSPTNLRARLRGELHDEQNDGMTTKQLRQIRGP